MNTAETKPIGKLSPNMERVLREMATIEVRTFRRYHAQVRTTTNEIRKIRRPTVQALLTRGLIDVLDHSDQLLVYNLSEDGQNFFGNCEH
jgi:hypothetical protein